jgi:hypothetical protein
LAVADGLVGPFFFVSGFFARKIPAPPPTSEPTSWATARPATERLKHTATESKNAARSIALALIITLLLLCGLLILRLTSAEKTVFYKEPFWVTEE